MNKTALSKAGAFWSRKIALSALWVAMVDSSVLCFLFYKMGQCKSLTCQRGCAGKGLDRKVMNGMEKPAKKGKNSQMFSSELVIPGKRDRGLHSEYYGEE